LNSKHKGQVNVSVANIYAEGTYHSEIISQAILGEVFTVLQSAKDFSQVLQNDGYSGWISNYQWVPATDRDLSGRRVRTHFISINEEPDHMSNQVRDASIGSELLVAGERDGWLEIVLPDGQRGWAEEIHFTSFPEPSPDAAVHLAREFLGYPYFWGGRSPRGFDCSGFVQRIHGLLGIQLPRDAWMQHRDGRLLGGDYSQAKKGDLYFFADNGNKINHVGLATGQGGIIHSRGMVRINSLKTGAARFDQRLADTFVDVRTYF
jgi:hypothetical protein